MVLSLQRMNRILEVNEKLAYIVVEPGVTFFDVYNYIVENKLELWASVPALGWGSVIAAMAHHFGRPPALHRQPGGGSGFRGHPPVRAVGDANSPNAHAFPNSFGPQVDGIFLQSNLGIVPRMAVALDAAPASFMDIQIHCPEIEDIAPLIDTL
ncbi:hypothetical protein FSOLCH5_013683 [Fusarium solani]